MAKSLTTNFNFRAIWDYKNQPDSTLATDSPSISDSNTFSILDSLANGSGAADLANLLWHDIRTLAASANEEFDLYGVLEDSFGDTLSFSKIRMIIIHNRNASTNDAVLNVGGATNAFSSWAGDATDIIKVAASGAMILWNPSAAGYAVTDSTADKLKIENTSGSLSIEYQIALIGE